MQLVAAEAAPLEVRQAAAVNFKNHVRAHWMGKAADGLGGADLPPMPDAEKVGLCCVTIGDGICCNRPSP